MIGFTKPTIEIPPVYRPKEDHPMTPYRDRLHAGHYSTAEPEDDTTVADLKDRLRSLDLPVSGNKAELQARLAEAQGSND